MHSGSTSTPVFSSLFRDIFATMRRRAWNEWRKEGSARVMLMCSVKHNPGNGGNSVKDVRCSRNFPAILAASTACEAVEVTLQRTSTTNRNIKNICDLAKKTDRWIDGTSVWEAVFVFSYAATTLFIIENLLRSDLLPAPAEDWPHRVTAKINSTSEESIQHACRRTVKLPPHNDGQAGCSQSICRQAVQQWVSELCRCRAQTIRGRSTGQYLSAAVALDQHKRQGRPRWPRRSFRRKPDI